MTLKHETMTRRLVVSGRVQGVGFRYSLADEARSLNLVGWVRNRRDGTVEAIVSGAPRAVEALVKWAHEGPPAARVTAVTVDAVDGQFSAFEILPTG